MDKNLRTALDLLREWLAESHARSFDDDRLGYVECQIDRSLIDDTAKFLGGTDA